MQKVGENTTMKRVSKENLISIILVTAFVINLVFVVLLYSWLEFDNKQLHTVSLSNSDFDGEKYVLDDFDVTIKKRGGDSGAWLKDPILDDDGNELHGPSVGIIYEMTMTNTSNAKITDWEMELFMPEFLWLNNAWNGTLEFHQSISGEMLIQELNLREYTQVPIILDYYTDHTGPMIPMAPGDSFVYLPSKADNEMPLDPHSNKEDAKIMALVGYIVYVPDRGIEYDVKFDKATFSYYLERNPWNSPLFIALAALDLLWGILIIAVIISQVRVRKLLKQQKHDAMIIEQSINTFINFIEAKDPSTKGHSVRVAKYAYALAVDMGYSARECNRIYYIALMHDCGKISIPANILRKPGKLTEEEYEEIKRHTVYGEKMLRDFTSIDGIDLGVLYHHERFDGKGYPKGLCGEDIPLIARIICVADALDAMNSSRCYRPRMTKEEILRELEDNKGRQFDPDVIEHLFKLIKQNTIVLGE